MVFMLNYVSGQSSSFLQNLRFGFGGGINFGIINSVENFQLYEDLSGESSQNEYSPLFSNFGNQYFFLAEYSKDWLVVGLRPGTYSYNFSRENILEIENSEYIQSNDFSLRYFSIPLEVKYLIDLNDFQPFIGGAASWGTLLSGTGDDNNGFINPRIYLGAVTGFYYNRGSMTFGLNIGYNYGLHVITQKDDRFNSSSSNSYSQDDLKLNDLYTNISILFSLEKKRNYSNTKCKY